MKSEGKRPVGIFDSGLGGLTVVKGVRKYLPGEDIIYFGDTARVPYGNKSRSTIVRFAREITAFMAKKKVKAVIVACNTASSLSLNVLKKAYPFPVIGVIAPGVKEALRVTGNGRIAVIGTKSTIGSLSYQKEIFKRDSDARVFSKSCPLFVPLVENGLANNAITHQAAQMYLKDLKKQNIDTLILGCTHYPILKKVIRKVTGKINLVDSTLAVVKEVDELFRRKKIKNTASRKTGKISCFVSDDVKGFRQAASMFLKEKIHVKKVVL
ncbi:MAG: glutamate racemase [Candidatus Omnitrophica bacterium]|nr:glutamate racemase [Candidatus Omnitrophota bacterium]